MVGFPFPPRDWADANGQTLNVHDNTNLFALYGTIYGGDGRTTFKLPDLRGRVPIHYGSGPELPEYSMGDHGGLPVVALTENDVPRHTHTTIVRANQSGAHDSNPRGNYWAGDGRTQRYSSATDVEMSTNTVEVQPSNGGGMPHQNMPPYLAIRFCVCLSGQFPPRH